MEKSDNPEYIEEQDQIQEDKEKSKNKSKRENASFERASLTDLDEVLIKVEKNQILKWIKNEKLFVFRKEELQQKPKLLLCLSVMSLIPNLIPLQSLRKFLMLLMIGLNMSLM